MQEQLDAVKASEQAASEERCKKLLDSHAVASENEKNALQGTISHLQERLRGLEDAVSGSEEKYRSPSSKRSVRRHLFLRNSKRKRVNALDAKTLYANSAYRRSTSNIAVKSLLSSRNTKQSSMRSRQVARELDASQAELAAAVEAGLHKTELERETAARLHAVREEHERELGSVKACPSGRQGGV